MVDLTKLNALQPSRLKGKWLAMHSAPRYMEERGNQAHPPHRCADDGYVWLTVTEDGTVHEHEDHLCEAHQEAGAMHWHHVPISALEELP